MIILGTPPMKIVIDSNVFFRVILGRKAGSASKTVISLITEGRISPYTFDALIGEIGRVVKKDKKLSQIDPIYFRQYIDGIDG